MPNAMLSTRDHSPEPLYRVMHNGKYVQFFYRYDNAVAFIDHAVSLGFNRDSYMIDEGF